MTLIWTVRQSITKNVYWIGAYKMPLSLCHLQEYVYPDARDRQYLLFLHKGVKRTRFDIEKYNKLKEDISEVWLVIQTFSRLHLQHITEDIKCIYTPIQDKKTQINDFKTFSQYYCNLYPVLQYLIHWIIFFMPCCPVLSQSTAAYSTKIGWLNIWEPWVGHPVFFNYIQYLLPLS